MWKIPSSDPWRLFNIIFLGTTTQWNTTSKYLSVKNPSQGQDHNHLFTNHDHLF
jgi:hypothetical protein